ncbi:acyl-ACP--UDP-N-acetylglucosamine O-acyltransferase [Candidatus Pandoraea novymonadis]|uniref:Acyl-[acyl-carrier-protein]--UDP-N-acetylglucosamine O-acyltransferase n=1 Tax=Candidatus Pandoraea novymonadis TaxID=1808959 RepID=A0ABX5FEF9_9BURK|nr:acyl-ACP--UDP-N-acetylglucosamine O-acyltransferase [Candidatus Pandoraea novymonadis]PSB92024.1 Acyl-[acyl-carrier-protein]--UDP-N-acetylglucosamine O-acyltransferase [Candidatus Pandoraea novymonadis]
MANIHSTAVVDPKAQLGDDVIVGPYSVIGPNVTIASGSQIGSHSIIEGHTTLGKGNKIGHFSVIGGNPQDMKYAGEPTRLVIGERNMIREYVTIHTGTIQDNGLTTVGSGNWIMAYVHIAHDCRIGNHAVLSNNAQLAGHVHVGDWAIIGGMTGVHQFVRIGSHAMVGGASVLVQDVPPFITVSGNRATPYGINVEGLRRRGYSTDVITALRGVYKLLYKSGLRLEEAKKKIDSIASLETPVVSQEIRGFLDFLGMATRGIVR